jgi:hypothetical protein
MGFERPLSGWPGLLEFISCLDEAFCANVSFQLIFLSLSADELVVILNY